MKPIPRLRMFAGPNGSGKSLLKPLLSPELLGVYVNPDEIEILLKQTGWLDLAAFQVNSDEASLKAFFAGSPLLKKEGLTGVADGIRLDGQRLSFGAQALNAYIAAVTAAFIREELLQSKTSFTTETVMSSPDKVGLLRRAHALGYRTYLYYIATDDPEINLSRIEARVAAGGHPVPPEKVAPRYHRSLGLLLDAIFETDRAYIFDNSHERGERLWIAEVTGGEELDLKVDELPAWFRKAVLDRAVHRGDGPDI